MDIQNALQKAQQERRKNILKCFSNQEELKEEPIEKAEENSDNNPFEEFEKAEDDERDETEEVDVEKGEVHDAISYGNEAITVKKKGSEIKDQAKTILLPDLESTLSSLEEKADEILADCGQAPTRPSSDYYYSSLKVEVPFKMYSWEETEFRKETPTITTSLSSEDAMEKQSKCNYPNSEAEAENRKKYNQIVRDMMSIAADIKTCEVLLKIDDKQEFNLTPKQVIALKF